MLRHAGEIIVCRPVTQVFDFLSNLENAPQWQNGVLASEVITTGQIGVGTRFKETLKLMGRPVEAICEIIEHEPGHRFVWQGSAPSLKFQGQYQFEPVSEGTRVSYTGSTELSGLWRLVEPLMAGEINKEIDTELKMIKSAVEAQPVSAS